MNGYKRVNMEFIEHLEKSGTKIAKRVLKVYDRDVFDGIFSDGQGHGWVESGRIYSHIPNYANSYAERFAIRFKFN